MWIATSFYLTKSKIWVIYIYEKWFIFFYDLFSIFLIFKIIIEYVSLCEFYT